MSCSLRQGATRVPWEQRTSLVAGNGLWGDAVPPLLCHEHACIVAVPQAIPLHEQAVPQLHHGGRLSRSHAALHEAAAAVNSKACHELVGNDSCTPGPST